jgi:DNA-binding MarR family transcriptional regulator
MDRHSPIDLETLSRDIVEIVPLVMRVLAAELRKSGDNLSPAHLRTLTLLKIQGCRLGELAEREQVTSATISRSVATLEERGWVRRVRSQDDRRVVVAELTPQGESVLQALQARARARVHDILGPVTDEEAGRLCEAMPILLRVFERGAQEAEAQAAVELPPVRS